MKEEIDQFVKDNGIGAHGAVLIDGDNYEVVVVLKGATYHESFRGANGFGRTYYAGGFTVPSPESPYELHGDITRIQNYTRNVFKM